MARKVVCLAIWFINRVAITTRRRGNERRRDPLNTSVHLHVNSTSTIKRLVIKCGPSSLSATRNLHDLCSADSLNSIRLVKQSVRGVISRLQAPMRRLQYRTSVDCSRSTRGHCSLHPQIGVYYMLRTWNPCHGSASDSYFRSRARHSLDIYLPYILLLLHTFYCLK